MTWMSLSPAEWSAITLSLKVALVSVVVSLPLAIWVAFVLARREFAGKALLNSLVHLPLVIPPVVTGYVLLVLFGRNGAIGSLLGDTFGIVFAFRWTGAALASAVMAFPLVVRAVRLSFEAVEKHQEESAADLGATPWQVFRTVTLPLALPGILAGMVLGFAKSMGEFGATITFVSNIPGETQTLPSAIYSYTQVPGGDAQVWRLTLIAVAVSMLALMLSELLARRVHKKIRVA
jgi:molybdate transport system permease protein